MAQASKQASKTCQTIHHHDYYSHRASPTIIIIIKASQTLPFPCPPEGAESGLEDRP